jgi:FkbM family methyltransferase
MEVEPGLFIPADLDDYMVYWCFAGEQERDAPFQRSQALIAPGDTVIDVGANIGLWVLGAARRVRPEGRVHAFEPVPENYRRLTANLSLNGLDWVECQPLALADRCGHVVVYEAANGNSGAAGLARREGVDRPVEVRAITLDEYCAVNAIGRVDFLKVDVEGGEYLVFRGAATLLDPAEAPAIFFEANEEAASRFASSVREVKRLLAQHGYCFYRHTGSRLEPVSVDQEHKQEDLFALKSYHFARYPTLRRYGM